MVVLGIPDPNRHKSEYCVEILANKLLEHIQRNRTNRTRDAEVVNAVVYTLEKSSHNDPVVDELRGILSKVLLRSPQLNTAPSRFNSKLVNFKDSAKCLCAATSSSPGIQLIQCVDCKVKFHRECLQVKQADFECPYCILSKLDPLNQVVECLFVACLPRLESYVM